MEIQAISTHERIPGNYYSIGVLSLQQRLPWFQQKTPTVKLFCSTKESDHFRWKCPLFFMESLVVLSMTMSSTALAIDKSLLDSTLPQMQAEYLSAAPETFELRSVRKGEVASAFVSGKVKYASGTQTVPSLHPKVGTSFVEKIVQHFGGGGVAGAIGAALVYPLDTIKTRMQAQSTKDGEDPEYRNELDCLRKVVSCEGIGALYAGLVPQLIGIAPEKAMKLTVNDLLLEILEHMMPGAGIWSLELIAGGGGGFSQVVFTNPMEIVKVRLQTQSATNSCQKKSWDVIKELGFQGLYYGAGVTMARDIPGSAIFFACYAVLKQLYPHESFADGFLAAIPATILSTPMDVIKTRLQMEVPPGEEPHANAIECLRNIWQTEGPKALFKGSVARVLRTSPQFGITFLVYSILCGGS